MFPVSLFAFTLFAFGVISRKLTANSVALVLPFLNILYSVPTLRLMTCLRLVCAVREGSNLFQPVRRPFVENEMCMDFRACSEIFPSAELW